MDIYTKFDLHIHSFASSKTKSGDHTYVSNSKIENIGILVNKLIENNVNIAAITDHNIFDKDIYLELKKQETQQNCIHKVLPGVEIDLRIEEKNVHVICIFDDSSMDHAKKIQQGFESKEYYTVDDLGGLLRSIELSTVLIAHQKSDYLAKSSQKTSLGSVGTDVFYKFIGSEFFDALEIQNTKVEGILRSRFADDNIENVNLVTGSDCHEWDCYPAHHAGATPTSLLYMKASPTFRGLIMSITDHTRIYNDVEPQKENVIKELNLQINSIPKKIPLSNKINVIIGDNAVGKSTLIKYLCDEVESSAMAFLSSHSVEILNEKLDKNQFSFSGQGKIRQMFESSEEKFPIKQRFKEYFKLIDLKKYRKKVLSIINYYGRLWERNEKTYSNKQSLTRNLYVPSFSDEDKHYLSIELNVTTNENKYTGLITIFEEFISDFKKFNDYMGILKKDDVEQLKKIRESIRNIGKEYNDERKEIELNNAVINTFEYVSELFNEEIAKRSNSDEFALNTFKSDYQKAIASVCLDLKYRFTTIQSCWDTFSDFKVENSVNQIGKYCFIHKPLREILIDKELICEFISSYIDIKKPLENLTTSEILTSIKGKRISEKTANNLNQLLEIIYNDFCSYYFSTTVEIKKGEDQLNESNSAGINALYYIDILSETYGKPIFIIDQPEDDVSQSRISTDLILSLKCLAKKAQVILVTHNPQLVVNLDADNVIVLKKDELEIDFYSGPLEYKNEQYSILELVAGTLDGGADVIKKRWKRYDKTSGL